MNTEKPHPPAVAVWLLRRLYPKRHREVLIGDLLEKFGEGHSDAWFWRQVVVAILVGSPLWSDIGVAAVGTGGDQLSSRLAVNGVVHLVLHRGEKRLRERMAGVVVHTGGVDVGNLLVKAPLAGANVLQTTDQLIEIIHPLAGVLQSLVIQHKALGDVLF